MPLPREWLRESKDRIICALVFVMGCGLLILGFSNGGFELLCAGAGAMFLAWRTWDDESDYLHWCRRRSESKKAGKAESQNKYPSDVPPAGESSGYDDGPHFTYDLGRRPISFPYFIPSEKACSTKSSWIRAIMLCVLETEQLELCILIALFAFGAVTLLAMAGSIYLVATYPIAAFTIGFLILFTLYIRDKHSLISVLALLVVLVLCLIALAYSVATYPIAALAIGFVILSALYVRDKLYLRKRRSVRKKADIMENKAGLPLADSASSYDR